MERRELVQHRAMAGAVAAAHRSPADPGSRTSDWSLEAPADPAPMTVDGLKAEVADLKQRLAEAAPRRAVVEMDRAITLLHHRVEDMRAAGAPAGEDVSYLAEELSALRGSLEAMQAPERFEALAAGLEMLSRKINILNAKAVDPLEMARLQAQSAELKDLVTRAVSGSGLQPLAERLAACAEQIARSGSESAQRVEEATSAFERNAEALITRVNAYEASAREGQSAAASELRRDVEANVRTIHDRLDQVSKKIAELSPALGEDVTARLGQLLDRIEANHAGDRALVKPLTEVVEHHLLTLTERFRTASARLERLDGIEAVLSHMIDEMQRVRSASNEATRDAVDAVARKVSADADGPVVVGLKRGLAALEARQNEVERRASELLGEVIATDLEDRTVVLGRTGDDVWTAHPPHEDEPATAFEGYAEPAEDAAVAAFDARFETPLEPRHEAAEADFYEPEPVEVPVEPAFSAYDSARAIDAEVAPSAAEPCRMEERELFAPRRFVPEEELRASTGDEFAEATAGAGTLHADADVRWPQVEPDPRDAPRSEDLRSDDFRPEAPRSEAPTRVHAVRRVRRGASATAAAEERARAARREPAAKRSLGGRISPATIAATGVAAVVMMAAVTAFAHRDTIEARASQALTQIKVAAIAPATPRSPSELPAPTGPQALRTAALAGNLAAAYEVGVRFADGVGIDPDLEAGIKWLGYAVSQGYAPAAYRLGSLYENGLHNMDEAFRFYKWAADQGNVRAMHNLGVLYSQGIAGAPDWNQAIQWFRKAADLGLRDSQHNLGIIFARGLGGTSDLTEALTWFTIAASGGDQDSADKRDALAKQANDTELARAKSRAAAFVPQAMNEKANTVASLPEWSGADAGATMASNVLYSGNLFASAGKH